MFAIRQVANSFAWLATLPDKSVDVIITDPPFTEHVHANLCSGSLVGKKSVPKYDLSFKPMTDHSWLNHALRVARRWVIVFCAVEDFGRFQDRLGKGYVRGGIWYKSNAMGQLTKDRPASAYEGIAILHRTDAKKIWNGKGSYGIWRCNGTRGKKDRHPNEKPVDLALKLIALFSDKGEEVLDPFCGSGAIGEASIRLGRNYLGLDQDPSWCKQAHTRLERISAAYDVTSVSDECALQLCAMRGHDSSSSSESSSVSSDS